MMQTDLRLVSAVPLRYRCVRSLRKNLFAKERGIYDYIYTVFYVFLWELLEMGFYSIYRTTVFFIKKYTYMYMGLSPVILLEFMFIVLLLN